jgi:hypothetical protein
MNDFKLNNQFKITTGFKTPDNYFENLSQNIIAKLPTEQPKVIPFYARKTTWIYTVAASVIIVLGLSFLNNFQQKNDQVNSIELEEYVEHHVVISDDDVAVLLDNESLKDLFLDLKINEEDLEETLSTEYDIETYLIN